MKDKIMEYKYLWISGIFIVMVLIFAVTMTNQSPNNSNTNSTTLNVSQLNCRMQDNMKDHSVEVREWLNENCQSGIPKTFFKQIPELDELGWAFFWSYKNEYSIGNLPEWCERLNESFWKQAEWTDDFGKQKDMITLEGIREQGREVKWGYGFFPAITPIKMKQGDKRSVCSYLKNTFGTMYTKINNLVVVYPQKANLGEDNRFPDGSSSVEQDPEIVKKYIKARVNPHFVTLGFTYPYFQNEQVVVGGKTYNTSYIQRIDVDIEISPDTPPGNYIIGVSLAPAPYEDYVGWVWSGRWYLVEGMWSIGRPGLTIGINVVE